MDMNECNIAETPIGRVALKKMGPVPENFRLDILKRVGKAPGASPGLKVTGFEFRVAKSGPYAGKLSIRMPGTGRSVILSDAEIDIARIQALSAPPQGNKPQA